MLGHLIAFKAAMTREGEMIKAAPDRQTKNLQDASDRALVDALRRYASPSKPSRTSIEL